MALEKQQLAKVFTTGENYRVGARKVGTGTSAPPAVASSHLLD